MSVRDGRARDLRYIVSLSKDNAESVGFLPTAAMASYLERDRVTLAVENGEPCGYFLVGALNAHLRIFQACVQYDARGLDHGRALLSRLIARAAAAGTQQISLHCRDGLLSNGFWSACGFESTGLKLGGQARRKIIHCWQLDVAAALARPELPYRREFLRSLTCGAEARVRPPQGQGITRTPRWTETADLPAPETVGRILVACQAAAAVCPPAGTLIASGR